MNDATEVARQRPKYAVWVAIIAFVAILCVPNVTPIGATDAGGSALLSGPAQRLAATTLLMSVLWMTQTLPIAVTALLPLALFPLLGIQSAVDVSAAYISNGVFLFLGGFVIALGIERWGLHRRIALGVVCAVGGSPPRIVLGFMLATAFLSMWISNTASTLLMLPIGLALLTSLRAATEEGEEGNTDSAPLDRLSVALMLGIAYSASIGGFSTLVGTPTNVNFQSIWETQLFPLATHPDAPRFSAGTWMAAVLPMGVTMLLFTWLLLVWRLPTIPNSERLTRSFFRDRLRALGRMSTPEWRMAILFAATAILWMTRAKLEFGSFVLFQGWGTILTGWLVDLGWAARTGTGGLPRLVDDSTVAMGITILLFALPSGERTPQNERIPLMDWPTAARLPWDILLLFGGGLALAGAFTATGLSEWVGVNVARGLVGQPAFVIVLATCLLMTFLTEVTSNVATVAALTPVLVTTSIALGLDPRLVCLPAVISASCAFMLPIATPPNAIVFGSGRVRMQEMMRYGFVLNIVGAIVITLLTFAFLVPQFGIQLDGVPAWAVPR